MKSFAMLSGDGVYRWNLVREWDHGPTCVFVMLNPSTADAREDDPTIRRCISFAKGFGCGSLDVVNLFGLRATDPAELERHPDPVGECNDVFLTRAILDSKYTKGPVIAAWGAHKFAEARAAEVIAKYGDYMMCLGLTKSGAPRHPLYVKGDTQLIDLTDPVGDIL